MIFLEYNPAVIAVAMIYFSLICLGIEVPSQGTRLSWWKVGVLEFFIFTVKLIFQLVHLSPSCKVDNFSSDMYVTIEFQQG